MEQEVAEHAGGVVIGALGLAEAEGGREEGVLLGAEVVLGARALRQGLQEAWGAGRGQYVPHPDGPEPPDKFWFDENEFHIPPTPCKLLACLWGKDKVLIEEAAKVSTSAREQAKTSGRK